MSCGSSLRSTLTAFGAECADGEHRSRLVAEAFAKAIAEVLHQIRIEKGDIVLFTECTMLPFLLSPKRLSAENPSLCVREGIADELQTIRLHQADASRVVFVVKGSIERGCFLDSYDICEVSGGSGD